MNFTTYYNKMSLHDLKIYGANLFSFIATTLNIEDFLKVVLVFASICYTVVKTISIYKNEIKKPKEKDNE